VLDWGDGLQLVHNLLTVQELLTQSATDTDTDALTDLCFAAFSPTAAAGLYSLED